VRNASLAFVAPDRREAPFAADLIPHACPAEAWHLSCSLRLWASGSAARADRRSAQTISVAVP
jgi:hypothetical protein